jgi:DNA-binding CsgD family transcriptional regulator
MGVLDDILDRIHDCGTAVVVRGGPGIGKTSLLAATKRRANECGMTVLSTSGVQTEADLRFGILYARAILADDNDAEGLYLEALASELGAWPFLRARVQLGYGAWLRRSRRIAESRAPLRAARDTFDALGTDRWAERARQELRASGERSRRRIPETRDELTPQELQIATLAASGLSNRDIGQQLYLSPRTVASHLYRLFPKLGLTSRSQLAGALRIVAESSLGSYVRLQKRAARARHTVGAAPIPHKRSTNEQ